MDKSEILVITGPTATGKTSVSIQLAKRLNGEIISADSMQIYRGMNIGTAKPAAAEQDGVPHHMLDVADPKKSYSVARYVEDAAACVADVQARGRLPILIGGTGLYIDSLLTGRDFAPIPSDRALRNALSARFDVDGGAALWQELQQADPGAATRIHANDKKRLIRALEVYQLTGETITAHNLRTQQLPPRYTALKFALTTKSRDTLYRRIDARVDAMLQAGLVDEVKILLQQNIPPAVAAMQAIGYKELVRVITNGASLADAIEDIKRESRRYAKRQLSWLRRDPAVHWVVADTVGDAINEIETIIVSL